MDNNLEKPKQLSLRIFKEGEKSDCFSIFTDHIYSYKFRSKHDLEKLENLYTGSYSNKDFKELIIDHLLMEFKHDLNAVIFGDPAGRGYAEALEEKYEK